MLNLKTKFFNPSMECRFFAILALAEYYDYRLTSCELFGFSSALYFLYARYEKGDKSFFSLFGKVTNMLKNLSYVLSGEWYCEYNGTIDDLKLLTNKYAIPVIVEVNFKDIISFYPNPIVKRTVGNNLAAWDEHYIFEAYPHELVVVGVDNNEVLCGDHISEQVLKIPLAEFEWMWSIPRFEYSNNHKEYYEYIILPKFNKKKFLNDQNEIVKIALKKSILNMKSNLSGKLDMEYSHGLIGLEQFIKDLNLNLMLPFANKEFSLSITKDLDSMYWKGMHRNTFAEFLEAKQNIIIPNKKERAELKSVIQMYRSLSSDWINIIGLLWDNRFSTEKKVIEKTKENLLLILEKETRAIELLSQIIS